MKLKNLAHWILVLGLSGSLLAGAADSSEPIDAADSREPVLQPVTENGITYVSGGNGLEERQALNEVSGDYNLKLVFAEKGSGAYLADVNISIMNMKGQKVLEVVSDGPWFFVKLVPGRYKITAETAGQTQARQAKVGRGRQAQLYFYWSVEE